MQVLTNLKRKYPPDVPTAGFIKPEMPDDSSSLRNVHHGEEDSLGRDFRVQPPGLRVQPPSLPHLVVNSLVPNAPTLTYHNLKNRFGIDAIMSNGSGVRGEYSGEMYPPIPPTPRPFPRGTTNLFFSPKPNPNPHPNTRSNPRVLSHVLGDCPKPPLSIHPPLDAALTYHDRVPNKALTYHDLKKCFHLPIATVASLNGVCTTFLKRLCRRLGIKRW